MKSCKRVLSLFISFCLLISVSVLAAPVTQADTPESAQTYVSDLIAYYRDYQEDATTDIMRTLDQLKKVDEGQYEAWSKIMDYWSYINTEMKVNIGVTEDGLPQDDSLCIVILGFALNPDGTMKEELIHRLEAGLASAEKYPNAYVVVTGGGTAAENPNVTEGGLMGEWLLEHGLDESRLIVENRAPSTVGNAENTFKILTEEYPQVKNIVMVTSDYHVPRGCILFYSKFVLSALASGKEPLNIVSNAGCETGSQGYESIALQASGVASVAGVQVSADKRPLSTPSYLTVKQNSPYAAGEDLDLTVTAYYDSGYSRDVTDLVEVFDFDPAAGPGQSILLKYTENGVTRQATCTLLGEEEMTHAAALIAHLIAYYRDYQESATTDIMRTLDELKTVDVNQYEAWCKIMDYWSYINTEMKVNIGVTADGLPQDDSLCIVILGFALNDDGTMKEELIHRLEVGLASAKKYPNAYVLVTGGGTAANNPNVTEGGLMGEWLLEQGLDPDRLIVENRAPDTVGNALNTFNILTSKYPQVKNIVMVTSDYHVPRGCLLFYSKFVLAALESGQEPLNIVSNAGCDTGSQGYETIALQAYGLSTVAGVDVPADPLTLSKLTGITVQQNAPYTDGGKLDLTVTATYDSGYTRDVTTLATVSDFEAAGDTVTVTYQENGVTCTATLTVQGEQPQVTPTPAPEVTDKPQVTQKPENVPQTGDDATVTLYVVTLAASLALLGGAVVVHRRRQR